MAFLDEFSETVLKKLGKSMYLQKLQQYFTHCDDEETLLFIGYAALKHIDLSPYVTTADAEGCSLSQLRVIADGLTKGLDVSVYAKEVFSGEQMSEILSGLEMCVDVTKYAKPMFNAEQMSIIRTALSKGIDIVPYIKSYAVSHVLGGRKIISNDRLQSLSYCLEHDISHDKIDEWLNRQNLPFNKIMYVVDAYNMGIDLCQLFANAENTDARLLDNWSSTRLATIVILTQSGVDVCENVSGTIMNMIDIIFNLSGTVEYVTEVLQTIQKGAKRGLDLTQIPYSYYKTPDIVHIINGMIDGYAIEDIVLV